MLEERKNIVKNIKKYLSDKIRFNGKNIQGNNGSLGKPYFDIIHNKVSDMKDEYYNGDEKTKSDLRQNVNEYSSKVQSVKESIDTASSIIYNDKGKSDLSNGVTIPQLQIINHIIDQESPKKFGENGFTWNTKNISGWKEMGGEIRDLTVDDLNDALVLRDNKASSEFLKFASTIKNQGIDYKNKADGSEPFNWDRTDATVRDFITPENIVSFFNDDLRNVNRTIKEDLENHPDLKEYKEDDKTAVIEAATNPDDPNYDYENSLNIVADFLTRTCGLEYSIGAGSNISEKPKPTAQELIEKYSV